jgi:hypothetical protein
VEWLGLERGIISAAVRGGDRVLKLCDGFRFRGGLSGLGIMSVMRPLALFMISRLVAKREKSSRKNHESPHGGKNQDGRCRSKKINTLGGN